MDYVVYLAAITESILQNNLNIVLCCVLYFVPSDFCVVCHHGERGRGRGPALQEGQRNEFSALH